MKSVIKNIKNIAWLCRPYWKYSKIYLIFSIAISVLVAPIKDIIYVYFPQRIIDLLVSGKSFSYVTMFALIVCLIKFFTYLIQCLPLSYFERERERVDLKIKRNIY